MINIERDILLLQESMLPLGMDISILELSNDVYSQIYQSDNKGSKDINGVLCLEKNYRITKGSSPVIMLIRVGKKDNE